MRRRRFLKVLTLASLGGVAGCLGRKGPVNGTGRATPNATPGTETPAGNRTNESVYDGLTGALPEPLRSFDATVGGVDVRLETMADGLEVPWAVDFSPDGRVFLTERVGRVRVIGPKGLVGRSYSEPPSVEVGSTEPGEEPPWWVKGGEGGLMGLALHPDFPGEPHVYVYYTYSLDGQKFNRISRIREENLFGSEEQVLLDGIPGGNYHDGGRIEFGPDGFLYVCTGDAGEGSRAQGIPSLGGKILRMTPEGEPAPGNPFEDGPYVYSYGHRNPQGLAFGADGALYSTEHGEEGYDEVNLVERGGNYGWPLHQGSPGAKGFVDPVEHSGTDTWAPSGAAFYRGPIEEWRGSMFFAALKGTSLHRLSLDGRRVLEHETLLDGEFGRLRAVATGPEGGLYFTTSNRDGRHMAAEVDDRVVRIVPR